MGIDTLVAHSLERIGALEQRLRNIEYAVCNTPAVEEDESEDEYEEGAPGYEISHRFKYPIMATANETDLAEMREIRYSMYEVEIFQPFNEPPMRVETTMTRDELDDFIHADPGIAYGEFLVSVKPVYKEHL